jgi:hypothetical protein
MFGALVGEWCTRITAVRQAGTPQVARRPTPSAHPGGRAGRGSRGQWSIVTHCFVPRAL